MSACILSLIVSSVTVQCLGVSSLARRHADNTLKLACLNLYRKCVYISPYFTIKNVLCIKVDSIPVFFSFFISSVMLKD